MRITKFKLKNYVSFYDENAEDVELGPGINFIVGKNNSGKTALINALSGTPTGAPHRSTATIQQRFPSAPTRNVTEFDIEYLLAPTEILSILSRPNRRFSLPRFVGIEAGRNTLNLDKVGELFTHDLKLKYNYIENKAVSVELVDFRERFSVERSINFDTFTIRFEPYEPVLDLKNSNSNITGQRGNNTCWATIAESLPQRTYLFQANRVIQPKASADYELQLEPDASNLGQVIHSIQTAERFKFQRFLESVQRIFPSIHEIVTFTQEGTVETRVEFKDAPRDRPDLAVSLAECGSGLGQVMAMLYVATASDESRTIIIDEPQSFLHPGAVRNLLSVFQENDMHQYIMTTHSPTAIMSVPKKTLIMLNRVDMRSEITTIDHENAIDLARTLDAVGSRPSDVFGMDKVIWVEGKTDATCFPLIAQKKEIPLGNARILELGTASNLTGRDAQKVLQIYQKLSQGGLLPRALAFVFDGDSNDKVDCDKTLKVEVNDTQHEVYIGCLKRRNFESYFLDFVGFADIVSAILNEQACQEFSTNYSSQAIRSWMDDHRADEKYFKGRDKSEETWLINIDGAKFLENIFGELSSYTLEYDKVVHGRRITESILEDDSNHFQEIVDLIQSILDKNKTSDPA